MVFLCSRDILRERDVFRTEWTWFLDRFVVSGLVGVGVYFSVLGFRVSVSFVSRSLVRKCCCRNGSFSLNMLVILGFGVWLEKVEFCRGRGEKVGMVGG